MRNQVFQLATKDKLFTPAAAQTYTSSEDHLAQIIELLGPIPVGYLDDAANATRYLNVEKRELRAIKNSKLHFWRKSFYRLAMIRADDNISASQCSHRKV